MAPVTLYREIDALGGAAMSSSAYDQAHHAGYSEALDLVLAILTKRGFSEAADAPCQSARCAVFEDLLETARIQVEHARQEAEKADDEAVEHKVENLRLRATGSRQDYALIKKFQHRAESAEAALAKATAS